MTNTLFILLISCLCPQQAMRMRENSNVLVPSNNVNMQVKIKKLLIDNDFDITEFSDDEMEKIDKLDSRKINKMLHQNMLPIQGDFVRHSSEEAEDTFNLSNAMDESFESSTEGVEFAKNNKLVDLNSTTSFPENNNSTTTSSYFDIISTTTQNITNFNATSSLPPSSTPANNFTSSTVPIETPYNMTNPPSTNNMSTTPNITATNPSTTDPWEYTEPSSPTTLSTTTVRFVEPDLSVKEECLPGRVQDYLKWVDEKGRLQDDYIRSNEEMRNFNILDSSHGNFGEVPQQMMNLLPTDLDVLSLAYNNYTQLPRIEYDRSFSTLKYLSLAGNIFNNLNKSIDLTLPLLKEVDLRNCRLRSLHSGFFGQVPDLRKVYLSHNNIVAITELSLDLFRVQFLDLSYNIEDVPSGDIPSPLKIDLFAFRNMQELEYLDLSHTRIDTKSIAALNQLPPTVVSLSLCYTELTTTGDNFLSNLKALKLLDISGNTQMNFSRNIFNNISSTLERLHVRDSNVRALDWTKPLINLRVLNLKDNKIRQLDENSFSHMLYLEDLNLERNVIGNWYMRLFSQNQELKTLNLRENTLTLLTDSMREDLLSVHHLALGKNDFECSCSLGEFLHNLFDDTKNTNTEKLRDDFNNFATTSTASPTYPSVSLGMRSNIRPEYDIIERSYKKYYSQILQSIEALRKNHVKKESKSLISLSGAPPISTVLLDYDEDNDDYQCMHIALVKKITILELIELCESESDTNDPPYITITRTLIIALSASIPTTLGVFILLGIIYWKWWHIRYFFVLCKNSAILTFMDDDDVGRETFVKRRSGSSFDVTLYDVFVSYSDQNREWVLDHFIPNMENSESISVCLHERDFQVGYGIVENIISCMDRSRCLLLLVSENFLQSRWCQFEMSLAQHRMLETRREKLILVLLEDIPAKRQPKTLTYLMKTRTYIKWPVNGSKDERQLFWKRLKKAIVSTKWENVNYGSSA